MEETINYIFKILFIGNYQFYLEMFFAMLIISINLKKRKYFWFLMPALIFAGFPFYWLPRIDVLGFNLDYIIVMLAIGVSSIFLYDEKINYIAINALMAFGLQHFSWNIMYAFLDLLPHGGDIPRGGVISIYITFFAVIYFLASIAIYKLNLRITKNKYNFMIYLLGAVLLLITFIMSQLIASWTVIIRIYTALTALLCMILMYAYPYAVNFYNKQKMFDEEKKNLERLIELQAHEFETYKENREIARIKYHDLKHQLNVLANINNHDDFMKYLEDIKSNINIYDAYAQTGNKVVDIVLTQKSLICANKNIRFTYIVDGESLNMFTSNDIASLLGNILDNAIEAASLVEGEYRLIKLNIQKNENFLTISEYNYTKNHPVFLEGNIIKSTKKDVDLHGYGMKSIRYICEKYEGEMNVDVESDTFHMALIFPIK